MELVEEKCFTWMSSFALFLDYAPWNLSWCCWAYVPDVEYDFGVTNNSMRQAWSAGLLLSKEIVTIISLWSYNLSKKEI